MSKNSLQALAIQAGLARGSRLFTKEGQQQLSAAEMSPVMHWQREHWLQLLQPLNQQLLETLPRIRSGVAIRILALARGMLIARLRPQLLLTR